MTELHTCIPLPLLTVRPVALPEPVLRKRGPGLQIALPSVRLVRSTARPSPECTASVPPRCSAPQHRMGERRAQAAQVGAASSPSSASPEKPIMDSPDAPNARCWTRDELRTGRSTPPSARKDPELLSEHGRAGRA